MSFAIGQRWISETENSLGLGMITALDFRSVSLPQMKPEFMRWHKRH